MNSSNSPKRLYRSRQRVIAGVCGGIAEYFNIDPVWVRIITLILAILGVGLIAIIYIVCWVIVPNAPFDGNKSLNG